MQREVNPFLIRLEKVVEREGYALEVIGSFATGLWIRQSNIDIQLVRKDMEYMGGVKEFF